MSKNHTRGSNGTSKRRKERVKDFQVTLHDLDFNHLHDGLYLGTLDIVGLLCERLLKGNECNVEEL